MPEHKALYRLSRHEAEKAGELNEWAESFAENCTCARAIERVIEDGYRDNRMDKDCAKKIIGEYGFDRVNWVLANTVSDDENDGRYSRENKAWAKKFSVPQDENFQNYNFAVHSHPGLVDIFANLARKAWQELGLFEAEQCYPEQMNYAGKIVALRPSVLKDEYKSAAAQLFYAESGFGCAPNAIGRKVFGRFVKDGERSWFFRDEIQGVVKLELLPDWAKEKQAEWSSQQPAEAEIKEAQ